MTVHRRRAVSSRNPPLRRKPVVPLSIGIVLGLIAPFGDDLTVLKPLEIRWAPRQSEQCASQALQPKTSP